MKKNLLLLLILLTLNACAQLPSTAVKAPNARPVAAATLVSPSQPSIPVQVASASTASAMTALPVTSPPISTLNPQQIACMAKTLYYEARGEGDKGMLAVGYVVMNRTKATSFKTPTVCGVVYAGRMRHGKLVRNACQFNWACDGRSDAPKDAASYARAQELAKLVMLGYAPNPIGKALYYHEKRLSSRRHRAYAYRKTLGHHFFYAYVTR